MFYSFHNYQIRSSLLAFKSNKRDSLWEWERTKERLSLRLPSDVLKVNDVMVQRANHVLASLVFHQVTCHALFVHQDAEHTPKSHWQTDTHYIFICNVLWVSEGPERRESVDVNVTACSDRLARMTQSTPVTADTPTFEWRLRSGVGKAMMQTGASRPKYIHALVQDETVLTSHLQRIPRILWLETC